MQARLGDSGPAPAPTIVLPSYTLADCAGGSGDGYLTKTLAPNGRYCVINHGGFVMILVDDTGRVASWNWVKWVNVVGWTADSRFAIFESHDQYNNRTAHYFDTGRWEFLSLETPNSCFSSMDGTCQAGVAAIAPTTSRLLRADGRLHDLSRNRARQLTTPDNLHYIPLAAWSPDETYLAYFAAPDTYPQAENLVSLLIGDGHGRDARPLAFTLKLDTVWQTSFTWIDNHTFAVITPDDTFRFTVP